MPALLPPIPIRVTRQSEASGIAPQMKLGSDFKSTRLFYTDLVNKNRVSERTFCCRLRKSGNTAASLLFGVWVINIRLRETGNKSLLFPLL
jgi:hypothetical protein